MERQPADRAAVEIREGAIRPVSPRFLKIVKIDRLTVGALMTVDPAGTGTDETTYTITKTLHGLVFLLDAGGFPPGQGHSIETLEGLAKLAERYKVNKILVEANFGDGMFAKLLQPHLTARYPVGVEEVKHNVQKERRICDTLEPVIQSHRLVVNADLVRRDFEYCGTAPGCVRPTGRRDRRNDSLRRNTAEGDCATKITPEGGCATIEMAVAYWSKALSVETEKVVQANRDKAMQQELERYLQHAIGRKPTGRLFATTMHRR
ncbi:MAG TPA: hypothetical protein VK797_20695 [Tepidisphaeraceae bacterium]|nr:hypothetical protein [Tepidisphaeraceae bacterium]